MQVVRTIVWVLVLVALLAFSYFNWRPVEVTIWDNLVVETKVPALVIVSFLLGLIPMWLVHRGSKWRLGRRISSLESSVRSTTTTATAPPPPPINKAPEPTPDSRLTPDPDSTGA